MENHKWLNLQLFAGEGAGDGGGEAAATGESAVDAGQQRLRELGVHEDKIRKNRAYGRKAPAHGGRVRRRVAFIVPCHHQQIHRPDILAHQFLALEGRIHPLATRIPANAVSG